MQERKVITEIKKEERVALRSARARGYARWVRFLLFALILGAIWQDRRLGPPVHDGMQRIAGSISDYIGSSENLSTILGAAQKTYADLREGE